MPRPPRRHPLRASLVAAVAATAVITGAAGAAANPVTETGANGATLTVSEVTDLDPGGQAITVVGEGFDEAIGLYVTFCVVPEPGAQPTPCLGGIDMEGETGASAWIASEPPAYGEGLATPFEAGGSFEVELQVAEADAFTDCADADVAPRGCAVVARADHTRTADRSQDVLVPVTFAGAGGAGGLALPLGVAGGAGLVALLAVVVVAARRRAAATREVPGAGAAGATAGSEP